MKILRSTFAACALATSIAIVSGTAAPPVNAATAIGVNGFRGGTVGNTLQGWVWEGATQRRDLDYSDTPFWMDSSIANGVDALVRLMTETPDVDRLIGESQSALVIIAALRDHPEIVPDGGLTIYMIGNPGRARTGGSVRYEGLFVPILGLTNKGAIRQDIPGLTVVDVAYEYDLIVDSPDPMNFLAVLNALAGGLILHAAYDDVDMTDPSVLVREVGNTTQYLVPVKRLPLLVPLYNLGLGAFADAIAPGLRAIIDAGHDREGYVPQGSLLQSQITDVPDSSLISSTKFSAGDGGEELGSFSTAAMVDANQSRGEGSDQLTGDNGPLEVQPAESPGDGIAEPVDEVIPGGSVLDSAGLDDSESDDTENQGNKLADVPEDGAGATTSGDTRVSSVLTGTGDSPASTRGPSAAAAPGSPGSRPSRTVDLRRVRQAAVGN